MDFKATIILIFLLGISYVFGNNCTIEKEIHGECKTYETCPRDRKFTEDDASCGTGKFPDVCCEVKPEDNIEYPFGQIAKRECEKLIENYTLWQNYDYALRLKTANSKEYLYIAALGYNLNNNKTWKCAGGLISDKHVITSATCLQISNETVKYVRLGDTNLNIEDEFEKPQDFKVVKAIPHPKYNASSDKVYHNLAILELDRKITRTEFVQPACLESTPQWDNVDNTTFLLTLGWGDTFETGTTYLERAEMFYYDLEKCKEAYNNTDGKKLLPNGIDMNQFCARGINEAIDTCLNDTGSPITRTNKHIRYESYKGHVIVGITDIGHLCDKNHTPGVYTQIYPYLPWIESIVWPKEEEEKVYWD